ncbi:hypothetical protein Tco_0785514 [Tanacetum coccineum]
MLEEESRSKMLLKQSDPIVLEKKVIIKPINYAELNRLFEYFCKRFLSQHDLSDEQALRLQTSHHNTDQSASSPVKIKAPRELPKMEAAIQQYHVDKQCFKIQKKQFLIENDRLLDQIISQDIMNIVVNTSMDVNTYGKVNSSVVMNDYVNYVKMCNKCLELEAELIKQHNMVEKDEYNRLSKRFSKLEHHCISLEIAMQLNKEIFQKNNIYDIDEIKTINIEVEHRVTKLIAENEHLKQTYKQLYDSIKPSCVRAKEQTESLVNQLNQKSVEITDLNAQLQEKVFVITALKNDLRKFKGKDIVDNDAQVSNATTIAPGMYKLDPHTMEQAAILREVVEQAKSRNPLDSASYSALNSMNVHAKYVSKKNKKRKEWNPIGKVFNSTGYKWKPTGKTFTLVGNACPLTRLTATKKVPLRVPIPLEVVAPKEVVFQIVLWYLDSGCSKHMTGDRSQLTNFVHKFHGTVKFGNDQVAKIMGYGDYQIGNVKISTVYYVEGLGHNLFSVGQFCDSDLEVAFRKHTCFVRNLEGVDLLSGS